MSLQAFYSRIDRVQTSKGFRLVASAVVLVVAVVLAGTVLLQEVDAGVKAQSQEQAVQIDRDLENLTDEQSIETLRKIALNRMGRSSVDQIAQWRGDGMGQVMLIGIVAAILLVVIWIGLALTYIGFGVLAVLIVGPAMLIGDGKLPVIGLSGNRIAFFAAGILLLSGSFVALVRGVKLLFSASHPVAAIAQNVITEAVRMKVSLVFIVLLIVMLATLPGLLEDNSNPLRYRVQSFMQYGMMSAYIITGMLVVFLSVGTVAFEQRDRIIWQTMTKPVASWQYILGKWLGVMGVAGVLLTVALGGVFLFTEYLRQQPAVGEEAAYVTSVANPNTPISERKPTEDRLALETQILTARAVAEPELEELSADEIATINEEVQARVQRRKNNEADFRGTDAEIESVFLEVRGEAERGRYVIDPDEESEDFTFKNLGRAVQPRWLSIPAAADLLSLTESAVNRLIEDEFFRTQDFNGRKKVLMPVASSLTLEYKFNIANNDQRQTYPITFFTAAGFQTVNVSPEQTLTLPLKTTAVSMDGDLQIAVINGRYDARTGMVYRNASSIEVPFDGLRVYYQVSGFRMNFVRAAASLFFKFALYSMIAVLFGVFLSFAVGSIASAAFFVGGEMSKFLWDSLEYYNTVNAQKEVMWHRVIASAVARPVAWVMKPLSELDPITWVVSGKLISWGDVVMGSIGFGIVTLVAFGLAIYAMRRRELAIYSGS